MCISCPNVKVHFQRLALLDPSLPLVLGLKCSLAFDILTANDLSMHVATSLFYMRMPNKASHCGNMLTTRETENLTSCSKTDLAIIVGGGKHFEIFRGPQNILVGPIWRPLSQKTRPHGHFWVPIRPNPFFALFIRGKGPKTGQKSADFKIRLILAQKW